MLDVLSIATVHLSTKNGAFAYSNSTPTTRTIISQTINQLNLSNRLALINTNLTIIVNIIDCTGRSSEKVNMNDDNHRKSISHMATAGATAIVLQKAGKLVREGNRLEEVARKFDIKKNELDDWMSLTERQRNFKLLQQIGDTAIQMIQSGKDKQDVAKKFGISIEALDQWLKFKRIPIHDSTTSAGASPRNSVESNTQPNSDRSNRNAGNHPVSSKKFKIPSKPDNSGRLASTDGSHIRRNAVCPKCQSTEWKSAQLVHREGIGSFNLKSSTSGVAITNGGTVAAGVASTTTSGVQQSWLSQLTAPPAAPGSALSYLVTGIVTGLVALVLLTGAYNLSSFILFYIGLGLLSTALLATSKFLTHSKDKNVYESQLKKYELTKLCTRCGHLYQ
jgi:transposase-like protein/predicted nucleic-acid-binding Zn-ribbon protein